MKILASLLAATAFVTFTGTAEAMNIKLVGSWSVDQGPNWPSQPVAPTGQETAAFLFGGLPGKYQISTLGPSISTIDNLAWASTWGGACGGTYPCGTKIAQNFKISTAGLYSSLGDQSTYVRDWAVGSQFTNYAFSAAGAVPEPAVWGMMILGFGVIGAALRRRVKVSEVNFTQRVREFAAS